MTIGRTTRMILRAIEDLAAGNDVTIVGFTRDEAKEIALKVVRVARTLQLPCANLRGTDPLSPRVRVRALGDRPKRWGPRIKVHIDHRAVFERPTPAPSRSVFA